jgi:hypothetical protein
LAKKQGELGAKQWRRNYNLKRQYGITIADFERMNEAQKGLCAICGKPPKGKRRNQYMAWQSALVVDHCHETGRVRGLLCTPCNRAIGFMDNADWLRGALRYLQVS